MLLVRKSGRAERERRKDYEGYQGEETLKEAPHLPVTDDQWKEIEQKVLAMVPSQAEK